jgi:hypothetical protein
MDQVGCIVCMQGLHQFINQTANLWANYMGKKFENPIQLIKISKNLDSEFFVNVGIF